MAEKTSFFVWPEVKLSLLTDRPLTTRCHKHLLFKISVFVRNRRAFSASIPSSGTGFRASLGGLFYLSQLTETVKAVFTLKLNSKFWRLRVEMDCAKISSGGLPEENLPSADSPSYLRRCLRVLCGQSLFTNRVIFLKLFSCSEFSTR